MQKFTNLGDGIYFKIICITNRATSCSTLNNVVSLCFSLLSKNEQARVIKIEETTNIKKKFTYSKCCHSLYQSDIANINWECRKGIENAYFYHTKHPFLNILLFYFFI